MSRRRTAVAAVAAAVVLAAGLGAAFRLLPDRGIVAAPAAAPDPAVARSAEEASGTTDRDGDIATADAVFRRHFHAGVRFLQQGDYRQAADMFGLARRIAPGVPEVHVNLGFAYLGLGEPELAVPAFEHAIELRPSQANAYYGLADALKSVGDNAGALGAARTYVHLTPEDDPYRRRALAAIWELQETVEAGSSMILDDADPEAAPGGTGSDGGTVAVESGDGGEAK